MINIGRVKMLVYEELLDNDPRWALSEGSRHFEEDSAVFKALRNIAKRLNDLGIPYVVVGGMALFRHGLRRFTENVDILVRKEDLKHASTRAWMVSATCRRLQTANTFETLRRV